jgi:hypothetical protein
MNRKMHKLFAFYKLEEEWSYKSRQLFISLPGMNVSRGLFMPWKQRPLTIDLSSDKDVKNKFINNDKLPCNDDNDQQQHPHCWNQSPALQKKCHWNHNSGQSSISLQHFLQQILITAPGLLVRVSHIVGPRWPSLTAPSYWQHIDKNQTSN